MNQLHPAVKLPQPGNYDYLELPSELQQLITAMLALESASAALDSSERATRDLDLALDSAVRNEWRWYQEASADAWIFCQRLRARAELAYVTWLIEREREEGQQTRGDLAALTSERLRLLALVKEA